MSTVTNLNDWITANSFRTQTNTNFANLNSTKKEDSMTTNKLLGRNTAWTGVIEEITLGTNLSMTGTTLNASWGGGITIGTTTITSGTSWRILYDNAWVVGELATNGTGNVSLTTSPTFVTPVLWAATATTINGATITSGTLNWTVTGTNTGDETTSRINTLYGTSNAFTAGSIELGNASDTTISRVSAGKIAVEWVNVGTESILSNSQSANYTTVLLDAGKHIYHPSADTTARTWTIDSNANVPYPIGTAITFVNDTSAGTLTIAITTDTLVLAGAGTTGSRTLTANGVATAIKVTSTRWVINWTNLT